MRIINNSSQRIEDHPSQGIVVFKVDLLNFILKKDFSQQLSVVLGIKYENFFTVFFCSIVPFSQENSKALNKMPFNAANDESEYRIWSAESKKCLVLNKNGSDVNVTFTGDGEKDETGNSTSKSQLFIFVVVSLVTYLTIKFDSQLRSSRAHHNHSARV